MPQRPGLHTHNGLGEGGGGCQIKTLLDAYSCLKAVGVMETLKLGCNMIRYDFKTEYYRKKEYRSQARDSEGDKGQ